jgi:SAM-dependent methyltransferase
MTLQDQFGNIDIYVFDQLLRGRIAPGMRVFDAGCGGGRNLVYLLREGYDVCGNDADANAVSQVRVMAASVASASAAEGRYGETSPKLANVRGAREGGPDRQFDFRVDPIERTSFPDAHADVVIASAVLHFARDPDHFEAMLRQTWRVLRPGGVFFARLASTIGIESDVTALGSGRFRLPDGSDRFLVDAAVIESWTRTLGGTLLDPIKTTVVHNQRSMTTWVARRA